MSTKQSYQPTIAACASLPRQIDRGAITHRPLDGDRMSFAAVPQRPPGVARAGSHVAWLAGHALPNLLLAVGSWVVAEVLAGCAAYAEGTYGIALDPADPRASCGSAPASPPRPENPPARRQPDLFLVPRGGGPSGETREPGRERAVWAAEAAAAISAGRHVPIAAPVLRLLARLQRTQSRRRAVADLHGLDERSLRDIGITRGEIEHVARHGSWFG